MLYRFAKYAGYETSKPSSQYIDRCADKDQVANWSLEAMTWCAAAQVMTGKEIGGAYYLAPQENATRAQAATVIWRMAGSPAAKQATTLPDAAQSWAAEAISWCQQEGIVTGYIAGEYEGTFQPNNNVTREELAVMLYRYAKWAGYDTSEPSSQYVDRCPDKGQVANWSL